MARLQLSEPSSCESGNCGRWPASRSRWTNSPTSWASLYRNYGDLKNDVKNSERHRLWFSQAPAFSCLWLRMTKLAGHIAVINCCLPGTIRNEILRVLDGAAEWLRLQVGDWRPKRRRNEAALSSVHPSRERRLGGQSQKIFNKKLTRHLTSQLWKPFLIPKKCRANVGPLTFKMVRKYTNLWNQLNRSPLMYQGLSEFILNYESSGVRWLGKFNFIRPYMTRLYGFFRKVLFFISGDMRRWSENFTIWVMKANVIRIYR